MSENLSPDSSIRELFDAVMPQEGMRVLPTSIPAPQGKANLAILITGTEAEANVLMANLMTYVQDMHDVAQQKEQEEEDGPSIIVPEADA